MTSADHFTSCMPSVAGKFRELGYLSEGDKKHSTCWLKIPDGQTPYS